MINRLDCTDVAATATKKKETHMYYRLSACLPFLISALFTVTFIFIMLLHDLYNI